MILVGLYKDKIILYKENFIQLNYINKKENTFYISYTLNTCSYGGSFLLDSDRVSNTDKCIIHVGKYLLVYYLNRLIVIDNYKNLVYDRTGPIFKHDTNENYIYIKHLNPVLAEIYKEVKKIEEDKNLFYEKPKIFISGSKILEKFYGKYVINFLNNINLLPNEDEYLFLLFIDNRKYNSLNKLIEELQEYNISVGFFVYFIVDKVSESNFYITKDKIISNINFYNKKIVVLYVKENNISIKNLSDFKIIHNTESIKFYAKKLNKKDSVIIFYESYLYDYKTMRNKLEVTMKGERYLNIEKVSYKKDNTFYSYKKYYEKPKEILKEIISNSRFENVVIDFILRLIKLKKYNKAYYLKLFTYYSLLGLHYKYGGKVELLDSLFVYIDKIHYFYILDFTDIENHLEEEQIHDRMHRIINDDEIKKNFFVIDVYKISYNVQDINIEYIFLDKYHTMKSPKRSREIRDTGVRYTNRIITNSGKYEFCTCIKTDTINNRNITKVEIFIT